MSGQHQIEVLLAEAVAQYDCGQLETAKQFCQDVLTIEPNEPAALHLCGLIANDEGDSTTAVQYLQRAIQTSPDDPDLRNDLGNVLQRSGRIAEAAAAFAQAVQLAPEFADAHSNYGYMLFRQGSFEESLPHFRRAIELDPNFHLAYYNLGSALLELNRRDEAIGVFRTALVADSSDVDSYINLGNALRSNDQHTEAMAILQSGIELAPHRSELFLNLGLCHKELGRFDEAEACYEQAIRIRPSYAEAHWNLSLLLLARGNLARGWDEFEWRRRIPRLASDVQPRNSTEWTGQLVGGKRVLVIAEQGMGDTMQFLRYAGHLKREGAHVIAAVQQDLLKILQGYSGVDAFVSLDEPIPHHDYYCYLMSLPRLLSPAIEFIPAQIPYLRANPELVAKWRERLTGITGFKIGIGWQGNPRYPSDRLRSIPLQQFEPLARVPGVHMISLQHGYGREQLPAARQRFPIMDCSNELDRTAGRFMDTAAVMMNLDLIITSDSAMAHLAGTLGVPVWVPLPVVPDWRWLLDRSDSPWYPTMRLFRQRSRGAWPQVFAEMAQVLGRIVDAATGPDEK